MYFLVWFDDNPKKAIEQKIADASTAYARRMGRAPNVALVSEQDNAPASVGGVKTRVERRVGKGNIHVGYEERQPQ